MYEITCENIFNISTELSQRKQNFQQFRDAYKSFANLISFKLWLICIKWQSQFIIFHKRTIIVFPSENEPFKTSVYKIFPTILLYINFCINSSRFNIKSPKQTKLHWWYRNWLIAYNRGDESTFFSSFQKLNGSLFNSACMYLVSVSRFLVSY